MDASCASTRCTCLAVCPRHTPPSPLGPPGPPASWALVDARRPTRAPGTRPSVPRFVVCGLCTRRRCPRALTWPRPRGPGKKGTEREAHGRGRRVRHACGHVRITKRMCLFPPLDWWVQGHLHRASAGGRIHNGPRVPSCQAVQQAGSQSVGPLPARKRGPVNQEQDRHTTTMLQPPGPPLAS